MPEPIAASSRDRAVPFNAAIFLSAFLLFQVQLLVGKYFLPWFGGTPAMWTTCMFFFQTLLLVGYLYSHCVATLLPLSSQGKLHLAVLLGALTWLSIAAVVWHFPLMPSTYWKPQGPENPVWHLVLLLAISSGVPYLSLSATGPLLQNWFAKIYPDTSPYRLYSLSNLGSFLALLTYPFIVEPWFTLKMQAWLWSAGFLLFVVFCGYCAWRLIKEAYPQSPQRIVDASESRGEQALRSRPGIATQLFWAALAACGSLMFFATTNEICQNIAVVPLLWVLPLSIYLLSFVICFDKPRWYSRAIFQPAFVMSILLAIFLLTGGALTKLLGQIICYSVILFVTCMVCHGELARSKPLPHYLTSFYLMVAVGGCVAGVFVALLAPHVFKAFWEYQLGLCLTTLLMFIAVIRDKHSWIQTSRFGLPAVAVCITLLPGSTTLAAHGRIGFDYALLVAGVLISVYMVASRSKTGRDEARTRAIPWFVTAALLVLGSVFFLAARAQVQGTERVMRNFYGVLTVRKINANKPEWLAYSLSHGRIPHGFQFRSQPYSTLPTSYYGLTSGVGYAVTALREEKLNQKNLRIGVIGLGVGTLASYARAGDYVRFYEINPDVIRLARDNDYFTYLENCPAKLEIIPGDGRLSMERELRDNSFQKFDLLVLDAFAGDAIPVHLLTKEAFQIYLNELEPDGVIAAHVTNTYLDLRPVVERVAQEMMLDSAFYHSSGDNLVTTYSDWVLLSGGPILRRANLLAAGNRRHSTGRGLWTDDYSNLLQALR
jgi:hypothetical protein